MEKNQGSPHQYGSLARTEWTRDSDKPGYLTNKYSNIITCRSIDRV